MDKTRKKSSYILGPIFALALAAELCLALDIFFTRDGYCLPGKYALAVFLVVLAGGIFLAFAAPRALSIGFAAITLLFMASALFLAGAWYLVYAAGSYPQGEMDKAQVFSGQRVLAIVPHPGDEQYLLCGVLEQYTRYGSQVWVAYLTNGDYDSDPELRLQEAAAALEQSGIGAGNIILLGYGEGLNDQGRGIYYLPSDQAVTSQAGYSRTYGTGSTMPFREGRDYTKANMLEDLKDLVLRYKPDVIFCTDYDANMDHQALSLLFDRAMGQVLREAESYRPAVFKGFAYSTGYDAPRDYHSLNMVSTLDPWGEGIMEESLVYDWADRLRLPVAEESIARSIYQSGSYQALSGYGSLGLEDRASGIVNGDKVFWQRETGSILDQAELYVSSGDGELLRDFVLVERTEPGDGAMTEAVWSPEEGDEDGRIIIRFQEPRDIYRLVFYDSPSLEDDVLDAVLRFKDGSFVKTGPLAPNGSATEVVVDKTQVTEIEIQILESRGERPGFTEIEVYEEPYQAPFSFLKIVDSEDNFVYDYYMDPSGTDSFGIYAFGCSEDLSDYRILCMGEGCTATLTEEGAISLSCPEGASCTLTVMSQDGQISDTVTIHNKSSWSITLGQKLEEHFRSEYLKGVKGSVSYRLISGLFTALGGEST